MLLRISFISSKENNSVENSIKKKQGYISKYNLISEKKATLLMILNENMTLFSCTINYQLLL